MLLNQSYNKLQNNMKTVIAEHSKKLTLISDDWSNSHDKSIINYLLVAWTEIIFLKSITIRKNCHTGKYIADELIEIISEIDAQNIVAVITNNIRNMKSSWQNVQQQYSDILCLDCSSHMTNPLVKNIMKLSVLQNYFEIVKKINWYWKTDVLIKLLQSIVK